MLFRPVIIAALQAAGLYLVGAFVPLLGQIALLFVPVPLVIVTVLHGRPAGLSAVALAAALVGLLGSWQTALLLFLLTFGLMAIGLAEGMLRHRRPETVVLLGSLLPLAALSSLLALVLTQTATGPAAVVEEFLRKTIADVQTLYKAAGVPDVAQTLDALSDKIVYYLLRLLPGIIVTTTVMQAAGCYGLARSLLLRRRPDLPLSSRPALPSWHAPDAWVWPLIAVLGLIALSSRGSAAWFAGLNLSFLFLFLYAAQGVSVMEFYYRKARVPLVLRGLFHAVILALPSVVAVVALGVVDIWADFRRLRAPAPPPAGGN